MRKIEILQRPTHAVKKALSQLKQKKIVLGAVGGRSVKPIYQEVAMQLPKDVMLEIFLADDRHVPLDSKERNSLQVNDQLAQMVENSKIHTHDENLELSRAANEYEQQLSATGNAFDLLILSAGEDGHVASLFPNHEALKAKGRYTQVYDSPKPPAERITITTREVEAAKQIILVFSGESKESAYKRFLDSETTSMELPAKYCIRGEGTLYVVRN